MNHLQKLLKAKTPLCRHHYGCLQQTLKYTLKNIKYGCLISLILQLIRIVKTLVRNPKNINKALRIEYHWIVIFLSSIVITLRLVRCGLRFLRDKEDGINSFIAGLCAGWISTKILPKQYWYFYMTFLGSRIIGAIHSYLIAKEILSPQNTHWHSYFMFVIANFVHAYGYFLQPYMLKGDMYKLYETMSALTPQQKRWHHCILVYNQRRVLQKFGPMPQFDKLSNQRIEQLGRVIDREWDSRNK